MAILKRRLNYANANGTSDTLYFETTSDMVVCADGGSAETALQTINSNLESVNTTLAGVPAMVENKAADVISGIVADSPEAFSTLKAFYDWTQSHETDAADMLSKINNLLTRVTALEQKHAQYSLIQL